MEELISIKTNEILEKMNRLNDKEYFIIESHTHDPLHEDYAYALFNNIFSYDKREDVLPSTAEKPFDALKISIDNKIFYFISDSIYDIDFVLRDDKKEIEKKLVSAERDLFSKVKELLGMEDCFVQFHDTDNVLLYFPNLNDKDVKEKEEIIDFYGEKIPIKIGKQGSYIYAEIPYSKLFKIYHKTLETYKKVSL